MIIDNFDPPSCVPSLGYVFSLEKIKYSMITDQKLAMAKSGNSRTPDYGTGYSYGDRSRCDPKTLCIQTYHAIC